MGPEKREQRWAGSLGAERKAGLGRPFQGAAVLGLGCQGKELKQHQCQEENSGRVGSLESWVCVGLSQAGFFNNLSSPSCGELKMPTQVVSYCNHLLIVPGQTPSCTQDKRLASCPATAMLTMVFKE